MCNTDPHLAVGQSGDLDFFGYISIHTYRMKASPDFVWTLLIYIYISGMFLSSRYPYLTFSKI